MYSKIFTGEPKVFESGITPMSIAAIYPGISAWGTRPVKTARSEIPSLRTSSSEAERRAPSPTSSRVASG